MNKRPRQRGAFGGKFGQIAQHHDRIIQPWIAHRVEERGVFGMVGRAYRPGCKSGRAECTPIGQS